MSLLLFMNFNGVIYLTWFYRWKGFSSLLLHRRKMQRSSYFLVLLHNLHSTPPICPSLHRSSYYESSMNSYSNDKEHIFLQILIFFVAANQRPMDLFRIHTVPVPLDTDTYQGKESKYTTSDLQYKYLATHGHEYMDVTDAALESCNTYHMDHRCENLHITTDVKELNCAIAIYLHGLSWNLFSPSQSDAKHHQDQMQIYLPWGFTPHSYNIADPKMKYCLQISPVKTGSWSVTRSHVDLPSWKEPSKVMSCDTSLFVCGVLYKTGYIDNGRMYDCHPTYLKKWRIGSYVQLRSNCNVFVTTGRGVTQVDKYQH